MHAIQKRQMAMLRVQEVRSVYDIICFVTGVLRQMRSWFSFKMLPATVEQAAQRHVCLPRLQVCAAMIIILSQ